MARQRIAVLADPVVRLDLGGEGIVDQTQRLHEVLRDLRPRQVRQGRDVRVEIAHRAVPLAEYRDAGEALVCALQPRHHIGEFLAQSGRAGRLPMGARQHRQIRVALRPAP